MSQAVEKFDPSRLMEGVRDRIKATFVSLIPDDQWETMVQKEIKEFFEPTKDRWGNRHEMSSFSIVCNEVMRDIVKIQVIDAMEKFQSTEWHNGELIVNETLKKALIDNAGELFVAMIGSQVQSVISNMKNRGY